MVCRTTAAGGASPASSEQLRDRGVERRERCVAGLVAGAAAGVELAAGVDPADAAFAVDQHGHRREALEGRADAVGADGGPVAVGGDGEGEAELVCYARN